MGALFGMFRLGDEASDDSGSEDADAGGDAILNGIEDADVIVEEGELESVTPEVPVAPVTRGLGHGVFGGWRTGVVGNPGAFAGHAYGVHGAGRVYAGTGAMLNGFPRGGRVGRFHTGAAHVGRVGHGLRNGGFGYGLQNGGYGTRFPSWGTLPGVSAMLPAAPVEAEAEVVEDLVDNTY